MNYLFPHALILIRGAGDLASGVAYRLHQAGFPLVMTEIAQPSMVRRKVAFAQAVYDGEAGASVEEYMEHQTTRREDVP